MVWQREDRFSFEIFSKKHKAIMILFMFFFCVLSVRLFYMQIIRGNHYQAISERQRLHTTRERAPRGIIYDSSGRPMVGNDYTYMILFQPFRQDAAPPECAIAELSEILNQDVSQAIARSMRSGRSVTIAKNLTRKEMFRVQEKTLSLSGITVAKEPQRLSRHPRINSHVTGYVSQINRAELDRLRDEGWRLGDQIGRIGIEGRANRYLRGIDGGRQLVVDVRGRPVQAFQHIAPQIGSSIHTTINLDLQIAAYEALQNTSTRRGAVVAIDPRTGAVRALVSSPGFDADNFSRDFIRNRQNPDLPLFNRALAGRYAPGSTFKIIPFVAALEVLNHNPAVRHRCTGSFQLGDRYFGCWFREGHGNVNFLQSMALSCNIYYYHLALELGVSNIERFARKFHLDQLTGIDIPGEQRGFIPNPEWKRQRMRTRWLSGDTLIFSIGQGATLVTPLQMASLTATVANRGIARKPFVIQTIVDACGNVEFEATPRYKEPVELADRTWDLLKQSLVDAVEQGTAWRTRFPNMRVAAKTGTAQNPHGENHAWLIAYAPADNPQLAVAVLVENAGGGGIIATPIARRIFEVYFNLE